MNFEDIMLKLQTSEDQRRLQSAFLSASLSQDRDLLDDEIQVIQETSPLLFNDGYRPILKEVQRLTRKNHRVDPVLLAEYLRDEGYNKLNGDNLLESTLIKLENIGAFPASLPEYANKLQRITDERVEKYLSDLHLKEKLDSQQLSQIRKEKDRFFAREADQSRINIRDAGALVADTTPPPEEIISHGVLQKNNIALLSGPPKTYKSMLILNLAISMALGTDWFQFKIPKRRRVLLFQAEIAWWALRDRLQTMTPSNDAGLNEYLFITDPFHCNIQNEADYRQILDVLEQIQPDVVIWDPLSYFHNAEANSDTEMQPVMARFRDIANQGYSSIIVHHNRKNTEGNVIDMVRGSSAITASVDSIMVLQRNQDERVKMSFDLRYDRAPDKMYFRLNAESLWLEQINNGALDDTAEILEIIKTAGPAGILKKDVVDQLQMDDRTGYRKIKDLQRSGIIETDGKKKNTRIWFPKNSDNSDTATL